MTDEDILDTALAAGLCLLENGAEISRVEDTTERIFANYSGKKAEVIATLTGITISCGSISKSIRVKSRCINLLKIIEVNQISRDISNGILSFNEVQQRMYTINHLNSYGFAIKSLAYGVCCCFFTKIYNGELKEMGVGFIIGIILHIIVYFLSKKKISPFVSTIAGSAVIGAIALGFGFLGICERVESVVIGSIMPLVPGMGITNALLDLSQGDYLSGCSRFFEALITALAVAAGAGSMIQIVRCLL